MRTLVFISAVITLSLELSANAQENNAYQIQLSGYRFSNNQSFDPAEAVQKIEANERYVINDDGRYRAETDSLYPGEIRFKYLEVGNTKGATLVDLIKWRSGIEATRLSENEAQQNLADLYFFMPSLLIEKQNIQKRPNAAVTFNDMAARNTTLQFSDNPNEPVSAQSTPLSYYYSDYQTMNGVRQPLHIDVKAGDRLVAQWTVGLERFHVNDDEFQSPDGYIERHSQNDLHVTPLAKNVYRIDGSASGYHMSFIIGDDCVAIIDAPVSREEAAKFKSLVDQTSGGKPIRYAILSHTHRDHIAGLPVYLNDNLNILTGKGGGISIARQHGDAMASKVREITETTTIDLGHHSMTIYPVNNTHAKEMLIAYDNEEKIIYQGDLFMMPEIGPLAKAFVVSEELMRFIDMHKLPVQRLTSVHGRVATFDELRASVKLRNP